MAKQKKEKPAKTTTGKARKSNAGVDSGYREEYSEQVYKLCLLGATDAEIADFFGFCEKTINNWKKQYPEFLQSITQGKAKADMEVAESLYDGARDRVVVKQQAFKVKKWNDKIKKFEEAIEVVDLEEFVPGDFRNQQFWLKNRKSDKWRDKQEHDHTTGGEPFSLKDVLGFRE